MKYIKYFILLSVISTSCDPYQLVYVKNYSDSKLNLHVQFQKQANEFNSFEINNCDSLIENTKDLLDHRFDKKITPTLINDSKYSVNLPAKSTSLLSPLTIGFPINQVQISGAFGKDSIFFHRAKSEMKAQIKRGRLEKINWTFYIYSYK